MRREPRRFFAVWPYIVSLTRSRRRTKTMRSPRSLLETIRAFRSQINSLSRLWSHPRGAAGSQGDSRWDHGGIARAKHHDYPTRTHAVTPADHSYMRAQSPAWTTPESTSYHYCYCYCYVFCCRRWNWPPYYWSPYCHRSVPFRTSGIRRIETCSVSSYVIASYVISLYCLYLETFLLYPEI